MMLTSGDRVIASYYFEDGSSVRVVVEGRIDTSEAIGMVAFLLDVKRKEIAKRGAVGDLTNASDVHP